MTAMVALLRGVNVGGRKLAMADLRRITEGLGHQSVATYIQSGNVVFTTSARSTAKVASDLSEAIEADTGMAVAVTARTSKQMESIVEANPFADRTDDLTHLHLVFSIDPVPAGLPDWYDAKDWAPEELAVVGGETYLHLPNGMGRSKLAVEATKRANRTGGARGTARNWRTVLTLTDMSREL